MGMVLCLKAADSEKIRELLDDPELIDDFLYSETSPQTEEEETDLDKAWHGIHFLLNREAWAGKEPHCFLVLGGEDIGDIDVGYGAARALSSEQVSQFDEVISKIDEPDFRQRFDPKAMMAAEIYPTIWDRDPKEDDTLGYLWEYFAQLKKFVKKAKDEKKGLVIWLS